MSSEIDLSLDDIIKLRKKQGQPMSARRGNRGASRGGMRSDEQQHRQTQGQQMQYKKQTLGRQTATQARNAQPASARRGGRGRGVGVSPLNRRGSPLNRIGLTQGQNVSTKMTKKPMGRGGRFQQSNRGGKAFTQAQRQQLNRNRQNINTFNRQNVNNQGQQQQQQQSRNRQKLNRQNIINQQRGIQVPGQNKQQNFRKAQNSANSMQNKQRRTNTTQEQSVMMITLANGPGQKKNNDIQLQMGQPKRRLDRTTPVSIDSMPQQPRRQQRQQRQQRQPITMVTQNSVSSTDFLISTPNNDAMTSPNGERNKKKRFKTKLKLQQMRDEQQLLKEERKQQQQQLRQQQQQQQQQQKQRKMNVSKKGVQQKSSQLQMQIKQMKPTVKQEYQFKRMDFAKAKTELSLSDRFSSVDDVPHVASNDQVINSRQVFM